MSNQPVPDPVEATFRDPRGAVYAGDDLRIGIDDLSLTLEGDPLLTGGWLDLRTGEVHRVGPLSVHPRP